MAGNFTYYLAKDCIVWCVSGTPDLHQGMSIAIDSFRQAELKQAGPWHILCDLRLSTERRSQEELGHIASLLRAYRHMLSGRMANVIAEPVMHGKSRMLAAYVDPDGIEIRPFYDFEEAMTWLHEEQPDHVPQLQN